ncbi:acyl carrier protein [Actinoplanes sp. NPDC049599]|uniref:acyl carrier protein n=1 Tax=Actinoplanes sp. NPDC049599 TaxID=3363903 RepID=UPI00379C8362
MATLAEISIELPKIVHDVAGVPIEDIQPAKSFTEDLDIDSLSMVEIMVAAEERFGVTIPDEDARELTTVGEVVAYIERSQQ